MAVVFSVVSMTSVIAADINGDTAFPICLNAWLIVPENLNPSGKPWWRAASRTEIESLRREITVARRQPVGLQAGSGAFAYAATRRDYVPTGVEADPVCRP